MTSDSRSFQVRPLKKTLTADGNEAVADRLIVRFQPSTREADRLDTHLNAAARDRLAGRSVGQLSPTAYLVDVSGAASLEAAAAAYKADPRVAQVGPDTLMRAGETPNDPRFIEQWGMAKIQAPATWNRAHGNSNQGGLIAILDSGINEAHPDLVGRVSARADFTDSSSGAADVHVTVQNAAVNQALGRHVNVVDVLDIGKAPPRRSGAHCQLLVRTFT